jgi:phosphopantetheinyl transferase (holo-ACP synthase)
MPITLRENIDAGVIAIWKVAESLDDLILLAGLSEQDSIVYAAISAPHRKKEWLAARILLNELIGAKSRIAYHSDGRPFIENSSCNISVSHTSIYVSIFLCRNAMPGIDIELVTRQVGRVAKRFLSTEELTTCYDGHEYSNWKLLVHWCAKEAIFKMVPLNDIEFATDIHIKYDGSISDSGTFHGSFEFVTGSAPIALSYRILDELLIVWGSIEKEALEGHQYSVLMD